MSKLADLKIRREEAVAEMDNIVVSAEAEEREVNAEEQARFNELDASCETLATSIKSEQALLKRKAEVEAAKVPVSAGKITPPAMPAAAVARSPIGDTIQVPASVKRWGNLKSFRGPGADVQAYKAGMFYLACAGNERAKSWMRDRASDIYSAAQVENVNTKGGYLVYDQLDNTIIDLRDTYGVFPVNARRVAMTSDLMTRPRRTGGLTAYFVGEDSAITESNKTWDSVKLSTKKLGVVARISNELSEDSIINIADDLTQEIAWAFAQKIDQCGFIGDGTSTYGTITGVQVKLGDINGVDEGGGLVLVVAAIAGGYGTPTLAEYARLIGQCPQYALPRAKFYCSSAVYGQSMLKLTSAGGGNTIATLEAGAGKPQFLGYPVEITAAMPSTVAASQIAVLFGDLALAADFGDRRQTTVRMSDSAVIGGVSTFERDETAIVGTTRFDINAHDLGTATAAGPVVGLILASA